MLFQNYKNVSTNRYVFLCFFDAQVFERPVEESLEESAKPLRRSLGEFLDFNKTWIPLFDWLVSIVSAESCLRTDWPHERDRRAYLGIHTFYATHLCNLNHLLTSLACLRSLECFNIKDLESSLLSWLATPGSMRCSWSQFASWMSPRMRRLKGVVVAWTLEIVLSFRIYGLWWLLSIPRWASSRQKSPNACRIGCRWHTKAGSLASS